MLDSTRRPCVTKEVGMGLSVTVSYHPKTGQPIEFFYLDEPKLPTIQCKRRYITLALQLLCYADDNLYRTRKRATN